RDISGPGAIGAGSEDAISGFRALGSYVPDPRPFGLKGTGCGAVVAGSGWQVAGSKSGTPVRPRGRDRYSTLAPNGGRYSGVVSGAKPWRMMFSVTTRGTRNWSR